MEAIAIVVSAVALFVSLYVGRRQLLLGRNANALPVLTEMFKEHREQPLAAARKYLYDLRDVDSALGFEAFGDQRENVLRLAWYYDNLGALVAHGVVHVDPVAGYLGGSMVDAWKILKPFVEAERRKRGQSPDARRWQEYFETLSCWSLRPDQAQPGRGKNRGGSPSSKAEIDFRRCWAEHPGHHNCISAGAGEVR